MTLAEGADTATLFPRLRAIAQKCGWIERQEESRFSRRGDRLYAMLLRSSVAKIAACDAAEIITQIRELPQIDDVQVIEVGEQNNKEE